MASSDEASKDFEYRPYYNSSSGVVQSITIKNPGSGYSVPTQITPLYQEDTRIPSSASMEEPVRALEKTVSDPPRVLFYEKEAEQRYQQRLAERDRYRITCKKQEQGNLNPLGIVAPDLTHLALVQERSHPPDLQAVLVPPPKEEPPPQPSLPLSRGR
jgi:hypothetical protein